MKNSFRNWFRIPRNEYAEFTIRSINSNGLLDGISTETKDKLFGLMMDDYDKKPPISLKLVVHVIAAAAITAVGVYTIYNP